MAAQPDRDTSEVVELLSALIRNACVNDDSAGSGFESRNAGLLRDYLAPLELELHAPAGMDHRASLVARLDGTDPTAPTLLLLGHTDVVPVEPAQWSREPFGGELVDGEVWGRGAVDMLNQTAAMAVAFRRLAERGTRLRGTIVYAATADEEAGGNHGIRNLFAHHPDLVAADVVLTEAGGTVSETARGPRISAMVGEKGMAPTRIVVTGRAGHGSLPLSADNALVIAAEVVRRLDAVRPPTKITDVWRDWVDGTVDDPARRAVLLDEHGLWDALQSIPEHERSLVHACTHSTYAPTQVVSGPKSNVIPGTVTVNADVRLIGDERPADVEAFLRSLLADLPVDVTTYEFSPSSESSRGAPIWSSLERAVTAAYPDGGIVPSLFTGGTDGRHFRARGVPAFGFGVLSRAMPPDRYWSYFHGHDERIDVESLRLSTAGWQHVALDYLG